MEEQVSTSALMCSTFRGKLQATSRGVRVLVFSLVACYAVYLVQVFSPLRITTDSVEYLSVAASVADGHGFLFFGKPTPHPGGYAAMIALLDRMGIARPWSLVGLNCVFLLGGLLATYAIARRAFGLSIDAALLVCLLSLLNFLIVKHTPLVLSDIPFFGLSLASVALLVTAELSNSGMMQRATWLLLATVLLAAATLTRTIGVTLLPVLGWVLMRITGLDRSAYRNKRRLVLTIGVVTAALVLGVEFFFRSKYGSMFVETYSSAGVLRTWAAMIVVRAEELGELTLNIPATKIPAVKYVSWVVGLIATLVLASGLYRRRRRLNAADTYLLACLGGLLLTPWPQDARYWIPVLPIVLGSLIAELGFWMDRWVVRSTACALCALYAAMGVIALGYTSRITFSGPGFPELYGNGSAAPAYRMYLLHKPPLPGEPLDPNTLQVLQRYGGQVDLQRAR